MKADEKRLAWAGVACAVALGWIAHLPALRSGFVSDDYVYLRAARELSFSEYARAAFTPRSGEPLLFFASNFYRPLYFLSFWPLQRLFGGDPLPYHVLLLAIHSASIVMVYAVGRALTLSRWAAVLAALVFAAHPLPHEPVDWIASLNTIAVPLGLASVWAFLRGERAGARRERWQFVALSTALFALALGFRETSLSVLGVVAVLHLFPPPAWRLNRDLRSSAVLAPYVVIAIAYALVRTKLLTAPFSGAGQFEATPRESVEMFFDYLSMVLLPLEAAKEEWAHTARVVSVVVLGGLLAWSALGRQRLPLVAALCGAGLALPFCFSEFGAQGRYFYFPLPFFAIAVAAIVEWVLTGATIARIPGLRRAAPVLIAVALVVLAAEQWTRVQQWVDDSPDLSDAWVDQLRAFEDANGPGTAPTLCAANAPLLLVLFDAYPLEATAKYYFPEIETVVTYDTDAPPPGCERGFVYDSGD